MNDLAVRQKGGTPDNYNPVKGLKTIAVAEAAEKHFARAKDATHLFEAVETKLAEQRRFVIWWDGQEKQAGARGSAGPGRGNKTASQTNNSVLTLKSLGQDGDTVHRWRTRLKDEGKFETALIAAQERCRRVCEADKGSTEQRGASGTGENEWYTPQDILTAAREVLGEIDLDPASSESAQEIVKAKKYFSKEDNGLTQAWHGRVWLNPPYAQPHIANFVSKMVDEWNLGHVNEAIMLTHNYTDTSWFHAAANACDAICFTRGRIKFYDKNGTIAAPTQGQAFFYFGNNCERFAATFERIGFVAAPYRSKNQ